MSDCFHKGCPKRCAGQFPPTFLSAVISWSRGGPDQDRKGVGRQLVAAGTVTHILTPAGRQVNQAHRAAVSPYWERPSGMLSCGLSGALRPPRTAADTSSATHAARVSLLCVSCIASGRAGYQHKQLCVIAAS